MAKHIELDGEHLTVELVHEVSHDKSVEVSLSSVAKTAILRSRKTVEEIIKAGKITYGLNTGFGVLKDKSISDSQLEELQENLIRSHAVGVGEPFSEPEVRAAVLIRANSLARGYSGVRVELVEKLLELLNKGIYPYIPQQGSVGSSGDLAPLSHLSLVLMGEGEIIVDGKRVPGRDGLVAYNFQPLKLQAKEGLALNNGTSFLTAVAALNVYGAKKLIVWSDNALALSLEALKGTLTAFDYRIHQIRKHPGQAQTAKTIRELCEGSQLVGPRNGYTSIQDSYSLRCASQVHGAVKDLFSYASSVVEIELNSVTDNPVIFSDTSEALSGGNFHGEPVSLAMDCLSIAITELANISERRIAKMVDSNHSNGLPACLIGSEHTGLNSGFMIVQYTAAALVAEMKVYAHPVVVDSIPTSANQEDYVSFGTTASRKCREIISMAKKVIGIEIFCAAQGLDLRGPEKASKANQKLHKQIRETAPFILKDEVMYKHIAAMEALIE